MLEGRRQPNWIHEIQDDDMRRSTIDNLTVDDVFRCQFRTTDGAPKASLELIEWGLRHIERLRKAAYEDREKSAKSWQMWLVFGVGLLNIIATIILALLD